MSPQFPRVDRAAIHLLENSHVRNSLYNTVSACSGQEIHYIIISACSGQKIHGACFFLYDYSYIWSVNSINVQVYI